MAKFFLQLFISYLENEDNIAQWIVALAIGFITGELLPAFVFCYSNHSRALVTKQPYSSLSRHAMAIGVQLMTTLHINVSVTRTEPYLGAQINADNKGCFCPLS